MIHKNMCENVRGLTNNINHRKYPRNKNRKRIFIFTKNDPHGKTKRILLISSSHTKINQMFNNEIELENVLELDLKPRAVVSSPQFQPIEKKYANRRNKLRISTNDGKALSQSSLKISGNLYQYHKSKYTYQNNGHFKANYKVYRCQISTNQEACCCSCNSDAMFEVMKSLYDCYKKKNCDNCNCFLCGRWPRVERGPPERQKLEIEAIEKVESRVTPKKEKPLIEKAELEVSKTIPETKSRIGVGKALALKEAAVSTEKLKEKTPDLLKILETTPQDQKEKIIKEAILKGIPIPEAKTTSEKKIIDKIKKDVGLPPKPKSSLKKAKYENALNKGLITPLEGKTASQKEKILRGQANLGLKLPEGRTSSEQILIAKIQSEAKATKKIKQLEKKTAKSIEESKGPSDECICSLMIPIIDSSDQKIVSAHKIKKEKELGSISPLQGKTKSQKEKVFKGMALQGTALPEGKTASEKELLYNVRKSLGLPPAPKTPALRQKYKEATAAGVITPLEGKTAKQKEKILREQAALGIPLPEGRTASEKSLVAKIKAVAPPLSDIPVSSKILKKAKDTGLLTPIKGKTREEKEKILTGLAMHGVPLPEVRTASEKKIVDKIHANLGLPPPPVSSAAKEKFQKAYADGLIVPLEGKTASQKEKIIQNQANIGLALPVGRTSSEKVLIEKAKEFAPIQQLKGKPPKQKEKILKGLAMNGILLPEAKSPSEKKIIDKVRDDLGLPPEPTSDSEKRAYKQSIATGDIAPLEGKSPMQKEKILRNVAKMGLKLPTGRTPSEKALVAKVLATESTMPLLKPLSVEMERKAKRSVLMTRLEGKPPEHKEKILKELAIRGIPLPEARTASEKKLIDKVRKDVAFPPPKPVIGLPEGQLVTLETSEVRLPSQVVQKAKAAGLLTPLKGKKKEQRENILKGLAMNGIPLPEAKTPSEQKVIEKVQKQLGLPPVPEAPSEKKKYTKAIISGQIAPLEGKTPSQKEDIIKNQLRMGLNIPVGRTSSEKAIIDKAIQSEIRIPSQVLKKAKDAGLLTPLKGKKKNEKESILRGLAMNGIPLPEAKTSSENKIIEKVRDELGLPPEPESPTERVKYKKALISGQIAPLEGKSSSEKEQIIKKQIQMRLKLPKGRTSSEKTLINKVIKEAFKKPDPVSPQKLKKAIDTSMVVPLEGKTKEEKEKFLKDLALRSIPLPEAQTASDKKIIQKVQADVGLPPQPKTSYEKEQYKNALAQGYIAPLEGKTAEQKEKLLRNQAAMGLTLPKGRTSSEKDLIAKIKKTTPKVPKSREELKKLELKSAEGMKETKGPSDECICSIISHDSIAGRPLKEVKRHSIQIRLPSQLFRKAKEAGLLTPLEGKKKEQKEKILKGLAMNNIPLPIAKSPSENKIIEKVREDLGLPPVPETPSEKEKFNKAIISGQIAPLEGKTSSQKEDIIKNQLKMGFNLPIGRTSSEKALIDKVKRTTSLVPESKSLMVPLEGKTKEEKENILKDLALRGIPLPKAKTASDKKIIHKVQTDVGLPPPPKTSYEKEQYKKALAQGYIVPLEGKTAEQKEKLLRNQAAMGLTLPKGRTSSEKALISKIKKITPKVPKSREQLKKLETKSAKGMKEAKGPSDECICSIISSEVRTERPDVKIQSEVRVPSEVLKKAKDAGLLTPLKGKKKEQKESILKGLAMNNIPLPEATSSSDSKIIKKVQEDLGLPSAPETPSEKEKYNRAIISGKIAPLEGKTALQKEDIIRNQIKMGLRLPKGRTSSEIFLINKVKNQPESALPSQIFKKAKAAGLLTSLDGKKVEQKEKILKGFAMNNIPLPEAKTASENKIMKKVREDLGLPPAPESPTDKDQYNKAIITGQIAPLEGKTRSQKEEILKNQIKMGLNLPKGRTSSEKSLIAKIKKQPEVADKIKKLPEVTSKKSILDKATSEVRIPSEVLKKAKAAGLLTPLKGKKKKQKESILKGLAMNGIPLPEAKTSSEKKIIDKVRTEMGLPPEPESPAEKLKYKKAIITGKIGPLEGKTPSQKEDMIRNQLKMGLILPKGRTSSEKSLIDKVKLQSEVHLPPKQLKRAKAVGLLTPLEGKSKEQKESILKGLAMNNIPLPEAKSPSENKILEKVRADIGLPPAPELPANKEKYNRAIISGQIAPLEGKTASQKENIIRNQLKLGLIVPKGRTASEMSLIDKVIKSSPKISKTRVTPIKSLTGKTKEEKEKIIKDLAMRKIPLPKAKTTSDKKIIEKVQADIGLPPQPKTSLEKIQYEKAVAKGYITPLEGKSSEQKENILRKQAAMGIRLPKGRTSSEKALISKINTSTLKTPKEREKIEKLEKLSAKKIKEGSVDECICDAFSPVIKKGAEDISKPESIMSEQIKIAELLEGKSKHEKEKILKDLAMKGIALPEAKNKSEKKIIDKVRLDLGLPSEPKNEKEKQKYYKALTKGLLVPLEGKSKSQKEKILRYQAALGINLPKGRTPSEISIIEKVKKSTNKASKVSIISESIKDLVVKPKKGMAAKYGISESIQEVTKTTTCDKGCGCDTKKVKFKHSYVKIRITSPDVSSICPCPEECFPGVQEGLFTDSEGIKITVGRVVEIPGFLHNNQAKMYKKCSMVTLNSLNTFFNEENVEHKITRSESYLIKNRKNEFKVFNMASPKSISELKTKIDGSDDAASSILNKYNSTISSSLSSRIFEMDSRLSFVTPNSNSNKSLDVLHQCNRYFEDDVVDGSVNKFSSEINLKRSSCDSLNMISDIYRKSSSIYFNSEALVENLSQYLYALKSTRSDFQGHENYDFTRSSTNFEQKVKENCIEDVFKKLVAKELISQSSSFIIIVPTSSEEISDYSPSHMRSSICIQVSKNCCYRNTPRNKSNGRIKKIEFKFSNDDVSLRPCSMGANKTLMKRDSALQTRIQEIKKCRVISTDTTQDRPCCCDHAVSLGRSEDNCSTPSSSCVDKSTSSDKSYTNTTTLMDMLKKTMSIACGTGEDISKVVKQKNKPKVKQQSTDLPCGCCSSSIEMSHYEICVDVADAKKKDKNAPRSTSSTKSDVICQCPDESAAIDCDTFLKQVQSDLTQCTSGFKLKVAPRVSIENVLRYYAKQAQSETDCACSKRAQKNCECPAPDRVEPFKGLKLHMEGKGSAAKGLNGFLCFELLDYTTPYQSFRIDSNSMLVCCSSNHES